MKKEVLIWIILGMLLVSNTLAQTTQEIQIGDTPFLEMYLYSWGKGEETKINLDEYFSVKRTPGETYVASGPSEISINIDQQPGIATLVPSSEWIGTRRIVFLIKNEGLSEKEALNQINIYQNKTIKPFGDEEILNEISKEIKNSSGNYEIVKKLLEKLNNELGPEVQVQATREDKIINLNVGENVNINLGFEAKDINGIKTEKPKIVLLVNPVGTGEENIDEGGASWIIIIPIIFIVLSVILVAGFYVKDHYSSQINKFFSRFKKKREEIELEQSNYLKINKILKEMENVSAAEMFFEIIKEFFKSCVKPKYSENYTGLSKEIMLDSLDDNLKDNLIEFSKEISDLKFSGREIDKKEIKSKITKSKVLITQVLSKKKKYLKIKVKKESFIVKILGILEKKKISKELSGIGKEVEKAKKEVERERKSNKAGIEIKKFISETLGFKPQLERIKDKIKEINQKRKDKIKEKTKTEEEKRKIEKEKERLKHLQEEEKRKKKQETKEEIRKFLHDKFGLYKTDKEKADIARLKTLEKARKTREENIKEEERKIKERRKRHEKEKKEEERRLREKEEKKKIRKFLHDKFGFYKTEKEITESKRLKALEKARNVRKEEIKEKEKKKEHKEEKKKIRKFLHDKFGFYRTPAEKEEIRRKKVLEKARKTRENELKEERTREKLNNKERELSKKLIKEEKKIKKESKEIKKRLGLFIHNKLKLFRTPEEKIKDLQEEKKKREENLRKLKTNFLKEQIEKLSGKELDTDKKIEILEEELRKALRQGNAQLANKIDKKINSLYKTLPKERKKEWKPSFFSKIKEKLKESRYRPEYREIKERIIHPKKEHKEEEVRKNQIEDLIKRTKNSIESGAIKEAEALYERTSELLKGTSSRIKETIGKELEKEKTKLDEKIENTRERFDGLTRYKREEITQIKIKDNTPKIEELILKIRKTVKNDVEKANKMYAKATEEFKKIPEELPGATHERLYSQLRPLKNEILKHSINPLLEELKRNLKDGKIEEAREVQGKIEEIYSYLGNKNETNEKETIRLMIKQANELMNNNSNMEAREMYKKIMVEYKSLADLEKKKYYPQIRDLYLKLIR